jgi:myo-inositol 2-dehydrogenase/D-chiro-inositol 1-dehydrogenase
LHLTINLILFSTLYTHNIMSAQRLKIGCAGLGRMGKRHALNFLERTPRAELVAASSPDPVELEWAKVHLEPFGVRLYQNYDDMLKHEGLVAVVVASATAVHAEQAIKAIEADKHVLCEKPISTNVEIVSQVSIPANYLYCFSL